MLRSVKKSNTSYVFQGDLVYQEGWTAGTLYYLKEGCVEITISRNGETVVLSTVNSGEIFGELELVLNKSRFTKAVAKTYCEICSIDKNEIDQQLGKSTALIKQILNVQAKRYQQATQWAFGSSNRMNPILSLAEVLHLLASKVRPNPMNGSVLLDKQTVIESYNRISGLDNYEINGLLRLLEELNFIECIEDASILLKDADNLVERVEKLSKSQRVSISHDLQAESDFMDINRLGEFIQLEQENVLKNIMDKELPDDLLVFRKSAVARIIKQAGKDFFSHPKLKTINELEEINDIVFVDNTTLQQIFGAMDTYQLARLLAGTNGEAKARILSNLSTHRQQIIEDTLENLPEPDPIEVQLLGLDVIEQIRDIKLN